MMNISVLNSPEDGSTQTCSDRRYLTFRKLKMLDQVPQIHRKPGDMIARLRLAGLAMSA